MSRTMISAVLYTFFISLVNAKDESVVLKIQPETIVNTFKSMMKSEYLKRIADDFAVKAAEQFMKQINEEQKRASGRSGMSISFVDSPDAKKYVQNPLYLDQHSVKLGGKRGETEGRNTKQFAEVAYSDIRNSKQSAEVTYSGVRNPKQSAEVAYSDAHNFKQSAEVGNSNVRKLKQSVEVAYSGVRNPKQSAEVAYSDVHNFKQSAEVGYSNVRKPKQSVEVAYTGVRNPKQSADVSTTEDKEDQFLALMNSPPPDGDNLDKESILTDIEGPKVIEPQGHVFKINGRHFRKYDLYW